MKNQNAKTPGIKIRTAKETVLRLVDRATGKWLANIRWRPHGAVHVELADGVTKDLVAETQTDATTISSAPESDATPNPSSF